MEVLVFLIPFVLLGIGGAVHRLLRRARRGPRGLPDPRRPRLFRVRASRCSTCAWGWRCRGRDRRAAARPRAASGRLRRDGASAQRARRASASSRSSCASCHNLDAVNARGVTGPDLDEIGQVDQASASSTRSRTAAPARSGCRTGLLEGEDAERVAPTWPRSPAPASESAISACLRLFPSRRRVLVHAAVHPSRSSYRGAGEPEAARPGRVARDRRSAALSARARQLTPQAIEREPMQPAGARALGE